MSNDSRDFGAAPSKGSGQGGGDRRDQGAEALLELARLIGGPNDPFAPAASRAEPRLGDVSRAAAAAAPETRPFDGRRTPDVGGPDLGGRSAAGRSGGYDFPPVAGRDEYPVAPRHDDEDAEQDFTFEGRRAVRAPAYRRRRNDPDDFAGDEFESEASDHFDESDEAEPPRRRTTSIITAVVGLAVVGSAAAYGYRAMMGAASGPTPIIRADNGPTRITPMSDVRAESGRTAGGEQLVRREEDPVGLAPPGSAGAERMTGDPKLVHTVPIRVDQGTAGSPDRPAPAPRAAAAPIPAVQAPAAAPPAARQLAALPPAPPAAPPRPAPAAPPAPPAPADPAAAAAPVDSGGYVVQITAVHSEAEAQSEFRRLQAKYSSVLSGRQPLIRRKDQGERGVFFVAQVGPFGAKTDAEQLCGDLKAAGGTCFVQRN
jgi:cell division septation protein DedD